MLKEHDIAFEYREYKKDPLSLAELRRIMQQLGVSPKEVLRTRDRAYGELGLTGDESDEQLLEHMAAHPTLLQRPIAVHGERAVVGRPPERILELLEET